MRPGWVLATVVIMMSGVLFAVAITVHDVFEKNRAELARREQELNQLKVPLGHRESSMRVVVHRGGHRTLRGRFLGDKTSRPGRLPVWARLRSDSRPGYRDWLTPVDEEVTGSEMVLINPDDSARRHTIDGRFPYEPLILQPTYMGRQEITRAQYRLFWDPNHDYWMPTRSHEPMTYLDYRSALEYVGLLSGYHGLEERQRFRLPSQKEWEFALSNSARLASLRNDIAEWSGPRRTLIGNERLQAKWELERTGVAPVFGWPWVIEHGRPRLPIADAEATYPDVGFRLVCTVLEPRK